MSCGFFYVCTMTITVNKVYNKRKYYDTYMPSRGSRDAVTFTASTAILSLHYLHNKIKVR